MGTRVELMRAATERASKGDEKALRYLYARYSNGTGDTAAIRDAIATLPAKQRDVAFMRYVVAR